MKKVRRTVFLLALLCPMMMGGCALQPNLAYANIHRIAYLRVGGQLPRMDMTVITSDGTLKQYQVQAGAMDRDALLRGELPASADSYTVTERTITPDDWDNLIRHLTRVDFLALPENLPPVKGVMDAPSHYIQVDTPDLSHRAGGYFAGGGTGSEHTRFRRVQETIRTIMAQQP